jgi:hypothetical protein
MADTLSKMLLNLLTAEQLQPSTMVESNSRCQYLLRCFPYRPEKVLNSEIVHCTALEMTQDKFVKEFIAPLRNVYSRPLPFTNIDPSSDNAQTFIYCMIIQKGKTLKKIRTTYSSLYRRELKGYSLLERRKGSNTFFLPQR